MRPLPGATSFGSTTFGAEPTPAGRAGNRGLKVAIAVLAATCLLLAGVAIGAIATRSTSSSSSTATGPVTPTVIPTTAVPGGTVPADGLEPAAAVALALRPAVVQLDNSGGLGSGVIYDARGLILTNAHVVEDSSSMSVSFDDGRTATGTVLGRDAEADIAVVQVDLPGLTAATLDEGKVLVGQMAIAIGSPFGLSESVTAGIVSAVDRPVEGSSLTINMIQTDAPINPGNSGGALANRSGAVIGINTAIFSQSGDNSGIGFAIPIQTAKAIADKIVAGESLEHGYLGIQSMLPDDGTGGAEITNVSANSPAKAAGLQVGDVITKLDGADVRSPQDVSARIVVKSPGDTVTLVIRRGGDEQTVVATLVARPKSTPRTTTTR